MNMPEFAKYVRVDTLLECYDLAKATDKALMQAMPNAYGGEAPGEDSWPEPDAKRDEPYKLAKVWNKLSAEVQQDIIRAYGK